MGSAIIRGTMKWLHLVAWGSSAALLGCAITADPPPGPARSHHRDGGFQNKHLAFEPKGMLTLLQWQWDAWRNGLPKPPQAPTPRVEPDLGFLHANATAGAAMTPAVTWIGHATVLAQFSGLNLLTDPVFSERASPVSFAGPTRAQPPRSRARRSAPHRRGADLAQPL